MSILLSVILKCKDDATHGSTCDSDVRGPRVRCDGGAPTGRGARRSYV